MASGKLTLVHAVLPAILFCMMMRKVTAEDLAPESFYEKYQQPEFADLLRKEGLGELLSLEGLDRRSQVHLRCFALCRGRRWPERTRYDDMLRARFWTVEDLDAVGAAITLTEDEEAILATWPEAYRQDFRRLVAFVVHGMRFYCDEDAKPDARSWVIPYYPDVPGVQQPDAIRFLSSLPPELIDQIRKEAVSLKDPRVWLTKSRKVLKQQGATGANPSISHALMPTVEYYLRVYSYIRWRFGDALEKHLDDYETRREGPEAEAETSDSMGSDAKPSAPGDEDGVRARSPTLAPGRREP